MGVLAVTQACSEPVFQSSTQQWGVGGVGGGFCHFQCCSALVLDGSHLSGEKIPIGIFAVTHACCEPVLQSSIYQWGVITTNSSAAVHWC